MKYLFRLFAAFAAVAALGIAYAQPAYPTKPIKLIVAYPPGGPIDIVGRLTAQKLGDRIGASVYVVNQPGANGNIGSSAVARSAADGYVLLMGASGPITINPSLYPNMPLNTVSDLTPVAVVAQIPLIMLVAPHVKVSSFAEFLAAAKAQPGKFTFASSGNGSTQHLAGEMLKMHAKIDIRHIPFRGQAQAMTDLLGGRVDMMIDLSPTAFPQIAAGKLRPLAVTTSRRLEKLPDVPTFQELGYDGYEVVSWMGVMAPSGTPKPVITKLHELLTAVTRDQTTREQLAASGIEPLESSILEFSTRITKDIAKWSQLVKDANVQVD